MFFSVGTLESIHPRLWERQGAMSRWWTRTARIVIVISILTIGGLHCEEFQQHQAHLVTASRVGPPWRPRRLISYSGLASSGSHLSYRFARRQAAASGSFGRGRTAVITFRTSVVSPFSSTWT